MISIVSDSKKSARDGFKKGTVEMLILALLDKEEMYGYQLSQTIEEQSEGILIIPEGSMYPTLYRLEENGLVNEEKRLCGKRRQRTYYQIRPEGRERLKELRREYYAVQHGINQVFEYLDKN